jgi:2-keto-3-deoxy-L-rhamnonate aldolase RhmA
VSCQPIIVSSNKLDKIAVINESLRNVARDVRKRLSFRWNMGKRLKEILARGKVARVFGVGQLCGPKIVEIIGMQGGFDAVWIDREHAGLSTEQIEQASRAAHATGMDSFVRLAVTNYASVMQPLEAGAGGIMAAQVNSARETADIVRWAKFHPQGMRGVNGTGIDGNYGTLPLREYFRRANEETFIAIQIENAEGLEEVEKIAAVKGVDILFVGPADLSQSLGIPAEWDHPKLWQAIERVAKASAAAGIHWAALPTSPDFARRCVALDCRMLAIGLDAWAVQRGLRHFQQDYSDFFQGS